MGLRPLIASTRKPSRPRPGLEKKRRSLSLVTGSSTARKTPGGRREPPKAGMKTTERKHMKKIVKATITDMPRPMPAGMFDPLPAVYVDYDDSTSERLFDFYPDEITFFPHEFVGLTRDQAFELKQSKDQKFLSTP
jgi:hypothetical protein